jgi:transcriptional regulator with XRE-family HTH domain
MSHIANAIEDELNLTKKNAASIAAHSGITEAQISRIRSGDQVWVGSEMLEKLAAAFFPGKTKLAAKSHARLLYAHLLDERTGPGELFIDIALLDHSAPLALNDATRKNVLPPAMQQNLDLIIEHITHNRQVRDLIQVAADLCRHPQPSPEKN